MYVCLYVCGLFICVWFVCLFDCLCYNTVAGDSQHGIMPLIKNYGFYEGATPYRVDPCLIYKLLNLP